METNFHRVSLGRDYLGNIPVAHAIQRQLISISQNLGSIAS